MNKFVALDNLSSVLSGEVELPSITVWNRLEGRPRTHDFDRALKAEVRDPLWMLTKQWQLGEFRGDDAGSPLLAKVRVETSALTKYRPATGAAAPFDRDVPFEAKVETRPVPFRLAGQAMALDLRLAMGRRWLKLIDGIEAGLTDQFFAALKFEAPDHQSRAAAPVAAHRESAQGWASVAGRAMDGGKLYEHLISAPGAHAVDLVTLADPTHRGALDDAEEQFLKWFGRLIYQPPVDGGNAWVADRLEYGFDVSAPVEGSDKRLTADEYCHGRLDWYNLDVDKSGLGLGAVAATGAAPKAEDDFTRSFLPIPVQFDGMPNTRWWTFEDGRTNFGDIDVETTDLNKLLLMEFGLVYANDWFLLPFTLESGSLARITGMMITNTFGERTWIEAAGRGDDEDWQRWSMFTLATRGRESTAADVDLVLLPSAAKIQDSAPLEEAQLVRDEMANMVWAVETRVRLPSGESKSGRNAALETSAYHRRLVEAAPAGAPPSLLENDAEIRYQLMTGVPENWIPLIPVHVENDNREIQLRRAAMLRLIDRDPLSPARIEPRTSLLRTGLDEPAPHGYDIHEEEVPRAGIRVAQRFRRARWHGGQVVTWLGTIKEVGRGESSSGLAFDQIPPKKS